MERNGMKIIQCDGLHVAATLQSFDARCSEQATYYPANYLIYVDRGKLTLDTEGNTFEINEGEFAFIKKYTHGKFSKSWSDKGEGFRDHLFILQDEFIKEVIRSFPLPEDIMPCTVPLVKLKKSSILEGLIKSVEVYLTGQEQIDRTLIRIKTMEALHAMAQQKPELIHVLNEFSEPFRADLVQFVEHNFTKNISLEQFARLSGRSLSTFSREFKREFNMTPHKWLKHKRLELANDLLQRTNKKASDVYLEVGFEDLAHFSRSFKSHFGKSPSEVQKLSYS